MSHLDYVYQIHHGRLPEPFGTQYRKVDPRKAADPARPKSHHLTAQHPPLFYFIASFPMGRLLDAGEWQSAVWRGRLLNVGIGLLCVLTFAWAGWRLGGRDRARLAIALPAIAGSSVVFVRLTGDIYNDLLVTLFSTQAVALSFLLLREGFRPRAVGALAAICALGMASKATFLFALVIALGSTFLAVLGDGVRPFASRLSRATGLSMALAAVAILPSFWFYLGNYRWSGSWFLAAPKMQVQGRVEYTALDVLLSENYWLLMPSGLLGGKWLPPWPNQQLSLWLFLLCAVAVFYLVSVRSGWKHVLRLDRVALAWLVIVAHFAGLMLAQFSHKVGWGQLNFRYLLPAMLAIGLFLAVPAVAWRRLSGLLVSGIVGLMVLGGPMVAAAYLDLRYPQIAPGESSWQRLLQALADNGFDARWLWLAALVVVAGLLTLLWAVPKASDVQVNT